ncbi:MAG: response regulator transcription factor [Clostridiales bacterium]|nr:response regulator transcription factor [Clostridiales bacterium]
MYKILIVEDDTTISTIIEEKLNKWGYITLKIQNFDDILSDYTSFQPHLVLMDINLPFYDGFYWCAKIRQLSNIPIIFISSRDTDSDKIRAISQGGDDYIEKPFSMDLLIAKVQAALRRAYSYSDQTLSLQQYKDMIFDIERLKVISGEKEIELTPNEGKILSMLMRNGSKVVTRTRLIRALWDDESFVDDNTLTVNVNRLRRKLKAIGLEGYIQTSKGSGYRLI